MRKSERNADHRDGGKYFESLLPTDHGFHQPERNDHSGERKYAADHGVEIGFRQSGYRRQRVNRRANRSPGHGRGIGDQIQSSGVEGLESQTDHERAGNRHWRAKARGSFDECAKTKRHQQHLQPAVGGDSGDRLLHDFKLPGLDGNIVEVDRGQNDPGDFQNTEGYAVSKAERSQRGRHLEKNDRNRHRRRRPGNGTPVRLHFKAGQQAEKHDDGKSRNQRGEPPMTEGIVDLGPLHHNLLTNGSLPAQQRLRISLS